MKRVNGWDERDYKLWSEIRVLPSFGIIPPNDRLISMAQVIKLLEDFAERRFGVERAAETGEGKL